MPVVAHQDTQSWGFQAFNYPSLIATISFMVGGFLSANLIMPFIFQLLK
jgi:hypothetical protein